MHIEKTLMKLNMSFLIKNNELLKKNSTKICKKVKNTIDNELDSDQEYNEKYLEAKIKSLVR